MVAHHNYLKWLETLFDVNVSRDENIIEVENKIICGGLCTCADGSN